LTALENFISGKIKTIKDTSEKNQNEWDQCLEFVKNEKERLRDAFLGELFSDKSEMATKKYVQIHQAALIKVMDTLQNLLTLEKAKSKSPVDLVMQEVEEILMWLETHFSEFISLDYVVPQSIKEKAVKKILNEFATITKTLLKLKIPDNLSLIVMETFQNFIDNEGETFYHRLYFIRELEALINKIETACDEILNPQKTLIEGLCIINFNSLAFFYYCKDSVYGTLFSQQSAADALYKLGRFYDYFSQLNAKPRISFNPHRPHITALVSDWIKEITKSRNSDVDEKLKELELLKNEEAWRIQTSLTVGELALIGKIFTETGAYNVENKMAFAAFMTRHFGSLKKPISEEYSVDHFYNSMSSNTEANIKSVRALLKRMDAALEKVKVISTLKNNEINLS
jgi:hypothetical protein